MEATTTNDIATLDPRRIPGLSAWLPESKDSERAEMLRIILSARPKVEAHYGREILNLGSLAAKLWQVLRSKPVSAGLSFDDIVSRPQARTERLGLGYIEQLLRAVDDARERRAKLEQELSTLTILDSISRQ